MEYIIGAVLGLLLGAGIGAVIGFRMAMRGADSHYQRRIEESERQFDEARAEAETILHEARLEAGEERAREQERLEEQRNKQENILRDRESTIRERELTVDKKLELLNGREVELKHREKQLDESFRQVEKQRRKVDEIVEQQNKRLETISQMTTEEAREHLFRNLEHKVQSEAAQHINEIRERARLYANQEARQVLINAMERSSLERSAQSTVTLVELPSDEIKGRIIGREGRNIRAFEAVTGVELLVDDTPQSVILSSFHPLRREIARLALEKLVNDGRIHPARIEEVVGTTREEINQTVMETGEQAMLDLGVHGLHPELIKHLGLLAFKNTMGQNILAHCREVAGIAGILAAELGLDPRAVRRAALLHDIGKAVDGYAEVDTAELGADLLRKYGESESVVRAVREQDESGDANCLEAALVRIADNLSTARPGIRGEDMGRYIERLARIEEIARAKHGVEDACALQAGRELRVVVSPSEVEDDQLDVLANEIAADIQSELLYPGQIRITAVREFRSVELAK